MHILFLTDNFPPEVNAPATRTYEHCKEWVKAGHRVTVVTCAPNFPKGKLFDGYSNKLWQTENMDGIHVIRVWTYITGNEGFAKRILDYLSFMVTATIASLFVRRVDIVIGTSPQFFTACAACMASAAKRCPWIFEVRDLWPESIKAVGAMRDSFTLRWLEKLELFLYRQADAVVAVTAAFRQNLVQRGVDEKKIKVVTNGVDLFRFQRRSKVRDLEEKLGLRGKFVAGYIGTHGLAHSLETIVDAAASLESDANGADFVFLLLGDGANKDKIRQRASEKALRNIIFLDSVAKKDVIRHWSVLDVSIVHLKKSELFRSVIPSKIFESMAMGIPILLGVEGESADIIHHHEVGLVFEPENVGALVADLQRMRHDTALRTKCANNGPPAARQFDRKALANAMLEIMLEVVGTRDVTPLASTALQKSGRNETG